MGGAAFISTSMRTAYVLQSEVQFTSPNGPVCTRRPGMHQVHGMIVTLLTLPFLQVSHPVNDSSRFSEHLSILTFVWCFDPPALFRSFPDN